MPIVTRTLTQAFSISSCYQTDVTVLSSYQSLLCILSGLRDQARKIHEHGIHILARTFTCTCTHQTQMDSLIKHPTLVYMHAPGLARLSQCCAIHPLLTARTAMQVRRSRRQNHKETQFTAKDKSKFGNDSNNQRKLDY